MRNVFFFIRRRCRSNRQRQIKPVFPTHPARGEASLGGSVGAGWGLALASSVGRSGGGRRGATSRTASADSAIIGSRRRRRRRRSRCWQIACSCAVAHGAEGVSAGESSLQRLESQERVAAVAGEQVLAGVACGLCLRGRERKRKRKEKNKTKRKW